MELHHVGDHCVVSYFFVMTLHIGLLVQKLKHCEHERNKPQHLRKISPSHMFTNLFQFPVQLGDPPGGFQCLPRQRGHPKAK